MAVKINTQYCAVGVTRCACVHSAAIWDSRWCFFKGQAWNHFPRKPSITSVLWLTCSNHLANSKPRGNTYTRTHTHKHVDVWFEQTGGRCVPRCHFSWSSPCDDECCGCLTRPCVSITCTMSLTQRVRECAEMCGMEWFTSAYIKPLSIFSASMTPDFCTEAISHTLRCAWAHPELTAVLDSCSACLPQLSLVLILETW